MTRSPPQSEDRNPETPTRGRGAPELAWDAAHFDIIIEEVWTHSLRLESGGNVPSVSGPEPLIPTIVGRSGDSTQDSFLAYVDWVLAHADDSSLRVCGTLAIRFRHKPGLPPEGVDYYSQVNAPILGFPYIRELIYHLTSGYPGGALVVRPLDVPKFVIQARAKWASEHRADLEAQSIEKKPAVDGASANNGA